MRPPALLVAAALTLALPLSTGCGFVLGSADFDDEVRALERRGIEADCEESIHVGSLLLSIARAAVHEDQGEDAVAVAVLDALRSLDVGTFRVSSAQQDLGLLVPSFAGDGWEPIVRVRSKTESAQVLVRERGGRLRGMMLAALDGNELTLVRLHGDLEPLLEVALAGGLTGDDGPLAIARR